MAVLIHECNLDTLRRELDWAFRNWDGIGQALDAGLSLEIHFV